MKVITATQARVDIYNIIDEVANSHSPIQITGKNASAILVTEEDWSAIQETLYLLAIPNMRESIQKGLKENPLKLSKKLKW